ncbi:hypothetical protein ACFOOP_01165 [Marinicaulis aureus]|uniref:Uncharacterized protein n=1 Tax=Hyphococcus aureus TaxID=2666033 RepID=A0ABW1KU51_9PROT
MTKDLNDLWRKAELWPANAASLREQIELGQLQHQGHEDNLAGYAQSPYAQEQIQQSDIWKSECVAVLEALGQQPTPAAAQHAYKALSAGYLSPYMTLNAGDKINPVMDRWRTSDANDIIASYLQFILNFAPSIIAVHNAMIFLPKVQTQIETDQVVKLGLNTNYCLADQACRLIDKALPKSKEKERLIFSLSSAGTDIVTAILLENTTPSSDRDIKDFILKKLFATPWPHGYVIEDYIDYIITYMEKGDLLSAVKEDNPEDFIIRGTLEIYTHVVRDFERNPTDMLGDDYSNAIEILFRLIDHLRERELSFSELEHLADIYNQVFSWTEGAMLSEMSTETDESDWLRSRSEDCEAAQKVLDVFDYPPNKNKLDAALSATDSNNFFQAFEIVAHTRDVALFDVIFAATENASRPRHLNLLAQQIVNEEQASRAIDWAITRFHISESGYSPIAGASGYNETLHALIDVAGDYPGLGGPLILAGLNYGTTSHDQSAKALLNWPLHMWPENAHGKLKQAVKNTERTLGLLTEAQAKLGKKPE